MSGDGTTMDDPAIRLAATGLSRDVVAARRQVRKRRATYLALGLAVPLAVLIAWEIAARNNLINRQTFPPPTRVIERFWHAATNSGTITRNGQVIDDGRIYGVFGTPPPTFWDLVWTTSKRVIVGFIFGSALGVIVGIATGVIPVVRAALEPSFNALYTVPKLALTPVFFGIWGVRSEMPMYVVATITTFFFVWISTMAAVIAIPEGVREAATAFGLRGWRLFKHVLWPAALPQVAVGLRIAAGVSVLTVLGAELLLGSNGQGIGVMIFVSKDLTLYDQMYVGILVAALMGVIFTAAVGAVTRRLAPWAPNSPTVRAT